MALYFIVNTKVQGFHRLFIKASQRNVCKISSAETKDSRDAFISKSREASRTRVQRRKRNLNREERSLPGTEVGPILWGLVALPLSTWWRSGEVALDLMLRSRSLSHLSSSRRSPATFRNYNITTHRLESHREWHHCVKELWLLAWQCSHRGVYRTLIREAMGTRGTDMSGKYWMMK